MGEPIDSHEPRPANSEGRQIQEARVPQVTDLQRGLEILTGFPFKIEGPFPEQSIPIFLISEDPVAQTIEEAKKVREQKVPEALRNPDPKQRVVEISTLKDSNLPVFYVDGKDDFSKLWTEMQPLLKQTGEGQRLLRQIETVDKLNDRSAEIFDYLQKLDDEHRNRVGYGNREMPDWRPLWSRSKDGSFYWVNVSDRDFSYILKYINEQAKQLRIENGGSVEIKTVLPGGTFDPIQSLTGINIPGLATRYKGISHLVVPADLAEKEDFQKMLVSPDIKGLLGDVLSDKLIFATAIKDAYVYRGNDPLKLDARNKNIIEHPDDIPQRLADTFNAILQESAPHITDKAQVVSDTVKIGDYVKKTLTVDLPYAAVVNTDVLENVSHNRAFQGLHRIEGEDSPSTDLIREVTGQAWDLTVDPKQNTCQFELPVFDNASAQEAVEILLEIVNKEISGKREPYRSKMEKALVEDPIRVQDKRIFFPLELFESFWLRIETSKKNKLLKEAIAKAVKP